MTMIKVQDVLPNPEQPRKNFDASDLAGLAQSIKANGLIQPIVVEFEDGKYYLIDGERRLRACKLAGLTEIEAVVRPTVKKKGKARLTLALVANIQRSAMGPVDEARAYKQLVEELGSPEAAAEKVGVSTPTVALRLQLLELPPVVQEIFNTKNLPLDLSLLARMKKLTTDQQVQAATIAATRGLSARNMMLLCAKMTKGKKNAHVVKTRQAVEPEPVSGGKFNALALVKKWKDLPKEDINAAKQTCRECPLYSFANSQTCGRCALPTYLNNRLAAAEV